MKTIQFLCIALFAITFFSSCSKDDDTVTVEETAAYADEVIGTYVGTIVSDDLTIIDTYEVLVRKLEDDRILIEGAAIPTIETVLTPQENPQGKYYSSHWELADQFVVAYWLESKELVFTIYEGNINFIGDKL
ncbi:MAG: hypothetical protein AAGI23_06515 [Bacteroidota bacterium]